jgi:hypothetical protein
MHLLSIFLWVVGDSPTFPAAAVGIAIVIERRAQAGLRLILQRITTGIVPGYE